MKYYVDSCIWLNLFKKEGDKAKGVPYWKIAKVFIEENEIIVSTIVLKELSYNFKEGFSQLLESFKKDKHIFLVKTSQKDYDLARLFERNHKKLSFYDYLHLAIARRLNVPLITRDKELLTFAKEKIPAFKPETLVR